MTEAQGMRRLTIIALLLAMLTLAVGCQSVAGKSARNIDDASITAAVKTRLVADKAVNVTRVDVDTNRGTVYLNGTVETPHQKARALRLAREVSGVKDVVDNLQVQKR